MGKTVPSYRMAVEFEIDTWRSIRNALASDEDQQAFDELMDMCRNNAMAGGAACKPILFEPMVMSILLAQQKRIRRLETKLRDYSEKEEEKESIGWARRGIKLSKLNGKLTQVGDLTVFLGKLQQLGLVKIVFDPTQDNEQLVQLTEKGRQEIIDLLLSD